jgi:hypothetical protein
MIASRIPALESVEAPAPGPAHMEPAKTLYGMMAEFEDHEELLEAARKATSEGYARVDCFSPFPVEGLAEALGQEHTSVPLFALLGGIAGGLGAYFMQWYAMGPLYPLNVGGRPHNSWPNFIPITFELTVLIASLSAFAAVLILNKLPEPYHPVFNVPEFRRASIDRFFLCIEAADPMFDLKLTLAFLKGLNPVAVTEVPE